MGMIATMASPGQRTLTIAAEQAPQGTMAVVVIRSRKTGAEIKYTVAECWLPMLGEWNRTLDAAGATSARCRPAGCAKLRTETLLAGGSAGSSHAMGHRARLHHHARFTALTR
jgi:hypothetical protein